jgi:hypothetical protein
MVGEYAKFGKNDAKYAMEYGGILVRLGVVAETWKVNLHDASALGAVESATRPESADGAFHPALSWFLLPVAKSAVDTLGYSAFRSDSDWVAGRV